MQNNSTFKAFRVEEENGSYTGSVKEMKFEKLGVFAYSLEEDTAAAQIPGLSLGH